MTDAAEATDTTTPADPIPNDGETITPDTDGVDQDGDDTDGAGDVFPRKVVEKLRKESADHRGRAKAAEDQVAALQDRAQTAESRIAAMQRQTAESRITAGGMRPSAVWAVTTLDDVLADDGSVDMAAVDRAMQTARSTLGIPRKGRSGLGGLHSGATAPNNHASGPSFADSFGPRKHD